MTECGWAISNSALNGVALASIYMYCNTVFYIEYNTLCELYYIKDKDMQVIRGHYD